MADPAPRPAADVPAWGFAIVALAALVISALPLATAWSLSADLGHGWALPWLIGWLAWERRAALAAPAAGAPGFPSWLLLAAGLALAVPLRLLLEPYPLLPTYLWLWGSGLVLLGTTAAGLLGGAPAARTYALPFALLLTGLPWPGVVENSVVLPLRHLLAATVAETMNLVGVPALANGTVIQIPDAAVGVDEACGGMRSLQSSIMIALFAGEAALLGRGRRLALAGLAVGAAIGGNLLRAFILTWAANSGGEARLQAWHDPVGYVALAATLLTVGVMGWRWRREGLFAAPAPGWPAGLRAPRAALAWGGAALLGLLALQLGVSAWFAPGRPGPAAASDGLALRWPAHAPGFKEQPLGASGLELLRPDRYQAASWESARDSARAAYFIEWNQGQKARVLPFLHHPDICLPNTGAELVAAFTPPALHLGGVELPFEGYEFKGVDGRLMHVFRLVWDVDEARGFQPAPAYAGLAADQRLRWRDVASRRLRARVQVCAFAVIGSAGREESLAAFARELGGMLTLAAPGP